jgi:hypothetical protein
VRSACYEILWPIVKWTGGLLLKDVHQLKIAPDIIQHENQEKEPRIIGMCLTGKPRM